MPQLSEYPSVQAWLAAVLLHLTNAFTGITEKLTGQGPTEHDAQLAALVEGLRAIQDNATALADITVEQIESLEQLEAELAKLKAATAKAWTVENERQARITAFRARMAQQPTTTATVAEAADTGEIVSVGRAAANPLLVTAAVTGSETPTAAEIQTALQAAGITGARGNVGGLTAEQLETNPALRDGDVTVAALATAIQPDYVVRTEIRNTRRRPGDVVPQAEVATLMAQAAASPISSADGKLYVVSATRERTYPLELAVNGGETADSSLVAANDAVVQKLMEWRRNERNAILSKTDAADSYTGFLKAVADYMRGDMDRVAASIGLSEADTLDRFAAAALLCGPGNQEFIWRACTSNQTPVNDCAFTSIPVRSGNQNLPLSRYRTMSLLDVMSALGDIKLGNKDCPDGTPSSKTCVPLPNYCGDRVTSTICAYWLCIEWGLFQEFTQPGMIQAQLQLLEMLEARWYEQQALDYIWKHTTHVPVSNVWSASSTILGAFMREMEARMNGLRLGAGQRVDIIMDQWLPMALYLSATMLPCDDRPCEMANWNSPADVVRWIRNLPGVDNVCFAIDPFDPAITPGAPTNAWDPTLIGKVDTNQPNIPFPKQSFMSVVPAGAWGRIEAFSVDLGFANGTPGVFTLETAKRNVKAAFKERAYGFYDLPPVDCFTPFTLVFDNMCEFSTGDHPLGSALTDCILDV